jgi:hypothetical protein
MNVREITEKAVATNYIETQGMKFKPLFPGQVEGPFLKEPYLEVPAYVLTKTHCEGYCDLCDQRTSLHDVDSFEVGCASGKRWVNGAMEFVTYSSSVPKKAIHLIRSPFDNIVARMHLGIAKRRKGGWAEIELAEFNDTQAGLLAWCHHVDERFLEDKQSPMFTIQQKELLSQLPCYSEWFRYVQWHSLAIKVINKLQLPSMVVHYEDYTTDYNATVQHLLQFMELRAVNKPREFIPGKTYRSMFKTEHIDLAAFFLEAFSTKECWALLRRYFDDPGVAVN